MYDGRQNAVHDGRENRLLDSAFLLTGYERNED